MTSLGAHQTVSIPLSRMQLLHTSLYLNWCFMKMSRTVCVSRIVPTACLRFTPSHLGNSTLFALTDLCSMRVEEKIDPWRRGIVALALIEPLFLNAEQGSFRQIPRYFVFLDSLTTFTVSMPFFARSFVSYTACHNNSSVDGG
jgi:hypothetical protein